MNYGPLLFLAAFFALAGSWFGFVLTPQAQVGRLQTTNILGGATLYPQARPGLARPGPGGLSRQWLRRLPQPAGPPERDGLQCRPLRGWNQPACRPGRAAQAQAGLVRAGRQAMAFDSSPAGPRGSETGRGGCCSQGPEWGRRQGRGLDCARRSGPGARLGQTAQCRQRFHLRLPGGARLATHRPGLGEPQCAPARCRLAPPPFVCAAPRGQGLGNAALPVPV